MSITYNTNVAPTDDGLKLLAGVDLRSAFMRQKSFVGSWNGEQWVVPEYVEHGPDLVRQARSTLKAVAVEAWANIPQLTPLPETPDTYVYGLLWLEEEGKILVRVGMYTGKYWVINCLYPEQEGSAFRDMELPPGVKAIGYLPLNRPQYSRSGIQIKDGMPYWIS